MREQVKDRKKIILYIWYLLVFTGMYVWFTQVHPLIVFDSDDWSFVSYTRPGLPIWQDWNPARVLPETLMPLVSNVAVFLLYPKTADYVGSIMIGSAVAVSLFIVVYVCCFTKLMARVFRLPEQECIPLSVCFFLLHFFVLSSEASGNQYLFYCWDLTCYFFYLIPSLLNASLVMVMTKNAQFDAFLWEEGSRIRKGLFLLVLYLAIFSNLPCSGILAAFAGSKVLFALISKLKNRTTWKTFFQKSALYLLILVLWLASAVFELSGGRAGNASGGDAFFKSIGYIVEALCHPTVYCNRVFLLTAFLLVGAAAVVWLITRKKDAFSEAFLILTVGFAVSAAALLVYIILLMAKVDWASVQRSEYLFGLFFYLLLLLMLSLGYVLHRVPNAVLALPILLYVLLTSINTTGQTFQESNMDNYPADICASISRDLVDQFIQADEAGLEHFELYVPVFQKELNWPIFSGYNGFAIADSLYEHGITNRKLEFTAVPTMEMNEKHQLTLLW